MHVRRQPLADLIRSFCKESRICFQELVKLCLGAFESEGIARLLHFAVDALDFAYAKLVNLLRREIEGRSLPDEKSVRCVAAWILRKADAGGRRWLLRGHEIDETFESRHVQRSEARPDKRDLRFRQHNAALLLLLEYFDELIGDARNFAEQPAPIRFVEIRSEQLSDSAELKCVRRDGKAVPKVLEAIDFELVLPSQDSERDPLVLAEI